LDSIGVYDGCGCGLCGYRVCRGGMKWVCAAESTTFRKAPVTTMIKVKRSPARLLF